MWKLGISCNHSVLDAPFNLDIDFNNRAFFFSPFSISPKIQTVYFAIAYQPFFGFWSASGQILIIFSWSWSFNGIAQFQDRPNVNTFKIELPKCESRMTLVVTLTHSRLKLFVATAHASSFYAIGLMDRDTFTKGFRRPSDHDQFSWCTIMPVVNLISIQFR